MHGNRCVQWGTTPYVTHSFYFEGRDLTSNCKQAGGTMGSGLKSDADGILEFVFYYYPDTEPTTSVTAGVATADMASGTKAISVRNADGTSHADSSLQVKQYEKDAVANTTTTSTAISTTLPTLVEATGGDYVSIGGAGGRVLEDRYYVDWY